MTTTTEMLKNLLVGCCFLLTSLLASAQYPYGGVVVEEVPIPPTIAASIQADAGFPELPRCWRVYVCILEPDWSVIQLLVNYTGPSGTPPNTLNSTFEVSCPTCLPNNQFYQNDELGGTLHIVGSEFAPILFGFIPNLEFDSWWNIGPQENTNETDYIIEPADANPFLAGGAFYSADPVTGATVYSSVGASQCNGLPDANGRVLVGQFTTYGVLEGNFAMTLSHRIPGPGCNAVIPLDNFIVNNVFFTNDVAYSYAGEDCVDLNECIDFGPCPDIIGYARVNGVCTPITGCDPVAGGVDYGAPMLFPTVDDCVIGCTDIFLPVNLIDYSANWSGVNVDLQWVTASETNSGKFTIERSSDMNEWVEIRTLAAAGNSTNTITYRTYDDNPKAGTNYYRLKQFDTNGQETLSEVRAVEVDGIAPVPYPNPASEYIRFNGDLSEIQNIRVIDLRGKIVIDHFNNGSSSTEINVSHLAQGSYLVELTTFGGKTMHHRLVRANAR